MRTRRNAYAAKRSPVLRCSGTRERMAEELASFPTVQNFLAARSPALPARHSNFGLDVLGILGRIVSKRRSCGGALAQIVFSSFSFESALGKIGLLFSKKYRDGLGLGGP